MERSTLASLWHRRALLTREQVFGLYDEKLRPIAVPTQVDICVPGMVGSAYASKGVAIVSVNPAGGRDGFQPTLGDSELYEAASSLRKHSDVGTFERLNDAFVAGMPNWGPQWRIIDSILKATSKNLLEISYPYLVPFRSRGDAGSNLPEFVLDQGYSNGFQDIIKTLEPSHIITVDRPSERACLKLLGELHFQTEITYLTRKRDAHAERAATLRRLSEKF